MSHKAAIIKSLLDEAFRVLQHDSPEDDPEYAHLRDTLGKSFRNVLKNAPIEQPAQARALTDEQILALNAGEVFFSESPSKYPEAGHGTQYHCGAPGLLKFARALLTAARSASGDDRE